MPRPILYSTAMVRAILDEINPKTQTRRVVMDHPNLERFTDGEPLHLHSADCPGFCDYACGKRVPDQWTPYGIVGDRLWVREAWATIGMAADKKISELGPGWIDEVVYRADTDPSRECYYDFRPSIHMPRWASRITQEIIGIRVERLHNISGDDAKAEACPIPEGKMSWRNDAFGYIGNFRVYWDFLNIKRGFGWDTNPWVWVIETKLIRAIKRR